MSEVLHDLRSVKKKSDEKEDQYQKRWKEAIFRWDNIDSEDERLRST